jgi:ComF family protein
MRCRERDYSFDSHVSVFMYRGVVKEMLQAYKFERRRELAATFARFVAGLLQERALENTVVVPSPPRSSAKRCRGWEHVQDIVRYLERDYHIPVLHLLSRRGGKTQKRLDYPGRRENIRGKIAARTGVRVPSQLVFFDDVFTTGSTADECATVLRKIGAERVDVVTVAMD